MELMVGLEPVKHPIPGVPDRHFVAVRKMDRKSRARYYRLLSDGDSEAAIDHLLEKSVVGFDLPSPNGAIVWSPDDPAWNETQLNQADEELTDVILTACFEVNGMGKALEAAREATLGNSGRSPEPPSEAGVGEQSATPETTE